MITERAKRIIGFILCAGLLGGCAAVVPQELTEARESYQRASIGPAAQLAPAELHKAQVALSEAEKAFLDAPESEHTKDVAYVAERKARMAEALAVIATERESVAQANRDYQATQEEIARRYKEEADKARLKLFLEEKARADAERRAADARAQLAKLAVVKEEPRGLVITLSGSVLFASGKAILLPTAKARLSQVAEVLMENKGRTLIVEGHTDSKGSPKYNLELSRQRAEAVRDYFSLRGYPAGNIQVAGLGKEHPIADNASPEGRANNRRVEIIVEREAGM